MVANGTNSGDSKSRQGKKTKNRCENWGVWGMVMHEKWHGKTVL